MLAHRDLSEAVFAAASPDLEKRQERTDLLLDRVETDELIEVDLNLGQGARRTDTNLRPSATPSGGEQLLGGAASRVTSLQQSFSKFFSAQDASILTDDRDPQRRLSNRRSRRPTEHLRSTSRTPARSATMEAW